MSFCKHRVTQKERNEIQETENGIAQGKIHTCPPTANLIDSLRNVSLECKAERSAYPSGRSKKNFLKIGWVILEFFFALNMEAADILKLLLSNLSIYFWQPVRERIKKGKKKTHPHALGASHLQHILEHI